MIFEERSKIISLIGLCGSGKSTLARKLGRKYAMPILTIGEYREKIYQYYKNHLNWTEDEIYDARQLLELKAWVGFFDDCTSYFEENIDIIIDTSGLNKRLEFLLGNIYGVIEIITIKLVCPLYKLKERVQKRRKKQKGFFPYEYKGHIDLNKDLMRYFKKAYGSIVIDTDKLDAKSTYKNVIEGLKRYGM